MQEENRCCTLGSRYLHKEIDDVSFMRPGRVSLRNCWLILFGHCRRKNITESPCIRRSNIESYSDGLFRAEAVILKHFRSRVERAYPSSSQVQSGARVLILVNRGYFALEEHIGIAASAT